MKIDKQDATVPRIDWSRITEKDFNDIVEALLVRVDTGNGLRAQALSGRGGDGGIDVDVRVESTNQLIRIYQLKYFPGGFSGGNVGRRRQIKKSLNKALDEQSPPVWVLVTPTNATGSERKAVRKMREGRKVTVRFIGPAELDGLLSAHPDIEDRFTKDYAVSVLREIGRPEAALAKSSDLHSEVSRLGDRLQGRSEYWGIGFALAPDGTYFETLFAKRSDASQREPLSITFEAAFGPADEEIRLRFVDMIKFGTSRELVLPGHVVQAIRREGPDWFQESSSGSEIHFVPLTATADRKPVQMAGQDYSGRTIARLSGTVRRVDPGSEGLTIECEMEGGLLTTWKVPRNNLDGGNISLEFDPTGFSAREVRRVLKFYSVFPQIKTIALRIADNPSVEVSLESNEFAPSDPVLSELIGDLAELEEKLDVTLRLPAEGVDLSDRLWARALALILRGTAVALPQAGSITGTLSGENVEGMRDLLTKGVAIVLKNEEWGVSMMGTDVIIGDVAIYSHHAVVDDGNELLASLEAGTAAGKKLTIHPIDDLPFVIYAPASLPKNDQPVRTRPWGLIGIPEHPKLTALPNYEESEGGVPEK